MVTTVQAVLFDLDGTLVDTAPDLAAATNRLRALHGLEALDYAAIRPWVSHGGTALTRLALGLAPEASGFAEARRTLLELYQHDIARASGLFAGMRECLATLAHRGLPWGIVTNKPGWLTTPLLAALTFDTPAACVVCGDCTPWSKPHPAPLLHASRLIGRSPAECLYVGDAERDIQAARAAGMPVLVATWGYLGTDDRPQDWGADGLIGNPLDLLAWLDARQPPALGR
ncbi:MAG TPA: phosphoglycolate phosphatase [Gammaproteobacteria bacterium]|nr:phosphoglycolate phosphatase [Gammaproteobacteria bacterium]